MASAASVSGTTIARWSSALNICTSSQYELPTFQERHHTLQRGTDDSLRAALSSERQEEAERLRQNDRHRHDLSLSLDDIVMLQQQHSLCAIRFERTNVEVKGK